MGKSLHNPDFAAAKREAARVASEALRWAEAVPGAVTVPRTAGLWGVQDPSVPRAQEWASGLIEFRSGRSVWRVTPEAETLRKFAKQVKTTAKKSTPYPERKPNKLRGAARVSRTVALGDFPLFRIRTPFRRLFVNPALFLFGPEAVRAHRECPHGTWRWDMTQEACAEQVRRKMHNWFADLKGLEPVSVARWRGGDAESSIAFELSPETPLPIVQAHGRWGEPLADMARPNGSTVTVRFSRMAPFLALREDAALYVSGCGRYLLAKAGKRIFGVSRTEQRDS